MNLQAPPIILSQSGAENGRKLSILPEIFNQDQRCKGFVTQQLNSMLCDPAFVQAEMSFNPLSSYLWKDWPPDIAQLGQNSSNFDMGPMAQNVEHVGSCKLGHRERESNALHQQAMMKSLHSEMLDSTLPDNAFDSGLKIIVCDLREQLRKEETSLRSHQAINIMSIDTYVCTLQRCREEKDLALAKNLHAQLCAIGLEAHEAVGNYVVPMFIDCGSLVDALQAFNALCLRNEISWTSLILGHVHCGRPRDAFNIYKQMQHENVHPKSYTLVAALQACAALKHFEGGLEIHAEALANGYLGDSFLGNSLINMYVQCGSLLQAEDIFNMLPSRDVVSWTSLIAGYVEHGPEQDALVCFRQMQREGLFPCEFTFACSLKACSSLGAIQDGREFHTEAALKGFDQSSHVGNTLIGLYGKCGLPFEAHQVFSQMLVRDVVSWTAVISGYAEHGPWLEALKLYDQMQLEGVYANLITFASVIKACGSTGCTVRGHALHTQAVLKGFEGASIVGNSLVGMYAKSFAFLEAEHVSKKLSVQDAVSWTALIAGYTDCGDGLKALKCFEDMQLQGTPADAYTYSCILKACSFVQALDKGRMMHSEIVENGLTKDGPVCNALIDMYAKCGSPSDAQEVFNKLQVRTVVSWTSLLMGYAEKGLWQEVFCCFEQMQSDGISPNTVTISSVLSACGNTGAIEKGRSIHKQFVPTFVEMSPPIANSLISMYAKCGSLKEAHEIFDKLSVRDVAVYSVMIKGYGVNCEARKAIECFEDMLRQGIKPDSVTLTCLLTACCHGGLVREGHEFFRTMREDYGIEPTLDHYVIMVGLFAKSGHLYEAEKFLEMLDIPYQRAWAALLSACKKYGDEELAGRSFEQLVFSNPHVPAWYVLMSDVLAGASKWDAACRLQDLRKHFGVFKDPASAFIEIANEIYEFVVGNSPSAEVSDLISMLNSRVKKEGHLPNVDSVVKPATDDEREFGLCQHAEKLAVAFGLIHTPQGQTLRVTKSMRICSDCHETTKIVSQIEKREIILRDDCSIHHFKEGSCSCGDMF